MTTSSRRTVIVRLVSVSAAVSAGGVLSACGGGGGGDDNETPAPQAPVRFDFGVASGDPLSDRVILWTHATRGDGAPVDLSWEIAVDAGFTQMVSTGQAQASPDDGYTVKVDAGGLVAGRSYHFRFRSGEHISPVGRTRTLPALFELPGGLLPCLQRCPLGGRRIRRAPGRLHLRTRGHRLRL
jgi:alkaline phosphatase D